MTDYQSERALLGAVLSGYPHIDELAQVVRPIDFDEPRDERIWTAILSVAEKGNKVDPVTVRAEMGADANRLPEGPMYLVNLAQECPTPTAARSYAKQVRDNSARRNMQSIATSISELSKADMDIDDMLDRAASRIAEFSESRNANDLEWAGDIFPKVIDIAESGQTRGLSTPWPGIDRLTHGIQAGRLYIVAARPGVGKSLAAVNLALHFATKHSRPSLICSMEMGSVEVMQRIVSAHASVNLGGLISGGQEMSTRAWESIARKHQEVMDMSIVIEDSPSQSLTGIRSKIRRVKRQRDDLALVAVDYLQLMRTSKGVTNRAEALGEISRGLKIIAREFNVAVVAMAQLNREAVGVRPNLAHLRESGSIEADADVVILLHRPDDQLPEVEAIIDKNRSGPRGTAMLMLQGHYSQLVEDWTPA